MINRPEYFKTDAIFVVTDQADLIVRYYLIINKFESVTIKFKDITRDDLQKLYQELQSINTAKKMQCQ